MTRDIREAAHLCCDSCQLLLQLLDRLTQGACLLLKLQRLQKLTSTPSHTKPSQDHLGQLSNQVILFMHMVLRRGSGSLIRNKG